MQQNEAPNNETVSAKVDSVPNFNYFLVFSNYNLDFYKLCTHWNSDILALFIWIYILQWTVGNTDARCLLTISTF